MNDLLNQLQQDFRLSDHERRHSIRERMTADLMTADFDPNGERLKAFGRTYGRSIKHNGQLVSCTGAIFQEEADDWCVSRAKENYGWKFRESWWQLWRPINPLGGSKT